MTTRYRGTTVVVNVRTPIRQRVTAGQRRLVESDPALHGEEAQVPPLGDQPPQALRVAHHRRRTASVPSRIMYQLP